MMQLEIKMSYYGDLLPDWHHHALLLLHIFALLHLSQHVHRPHHSLGNILANLLQLCSTLLLGSQAFLVLALLGQLVQTLRLLNL